MLFSQSVSSASMSNVCAPLELERFGIPLHDKPVPLSCALCPAQSGRFSALLKSKNFMLTRNGLFLPIILCVLSSIAVAQKKIIMKGSAAKPSKPVNLRVASDLAKRVAKFRSVEMPLQGTGLTAGERKMVDKLVEACHYLEGIFWRQMDP